MSDAALDVRGPLPSRIKFNPPPSASNGRETASVAPFNPTRHDASSVALSLLGLGPGPSNDDGDAGVLFDLGCGDGRVLIEAARENDGLRCVGVELEEKYVERAREAIRKEGLGDRVEVRRGDLVVELRRQRQCDPAEDRGLGGDTGSGADDQGGERQVLRSDLSHLTVSNDATAIFMYLLPKGIAKIRPILEDVFRRRRKMRGVEGGHGVRPLRIAAYTFSIRGWTPVEVDRTTKAEVPIYLYDETSVPMEDGC